MKILRITEEAIEFNNGTAITYFHEQDCCERNYADFQQIEDLAYGVEFDENLVFEAVPEYGFRFGSKGTPMFFIPCYSYQNGYYSSDISIYYCDRCVINDLQCKPGRYYEDYEEDDEEYYYKDV